MSDPTDPRITPEHTVEPLPEIEPLALADEDDRSEAPTASQTVDVGDLGALTSLDGDGDLRVRIEPRYEWGSAPADSDPVMGVLVSLTPSGAPLVQGDGPAAHVILCVDLSASMNHPDKYPVLTQALEGMIEDLRATPGGRDFQLSLVAFAKGAETRFRDVPVSRLSGRDVIEALDKSPLRFGRYTDIVGALGRAGRIAYDSQQRDPILPVRVYVMTDGKPQDVDGAVEMMKRVGRMPVDVDAFAFGADSDVDLLKRLVCGHRGGTVKHVRKETLGEAYARVGEVAQRVVAKRAILSFELGSGVVGGAAYRFRPGRHAYGAEAFEGGRVFETDLGTLESGRTYSLLFQVRLPQTSTRDTQIGSVTLRVPGWGGPQEFHASLAIPRHADTTTIDADPVVAEALTVLEAIDDEDPATLLKALRARRKMYIAERRDPYLLEVVDKAIAELEEAGNLEALSKSERAALTAHTATAGSGKPPAGRREYTFG